jgi:uncharacterized Ntn-hydrolase superfamily protein
MTTTTALLNPPSRPLGTFARLVERWVSLLHVGARKSLERTTRESASSLFARAAQYESTQPGFAADLRAAAEATERLEARRSR